MSQTPPDAKFQKLASEYSRIRAQIPVLKKGVLDEQAKQKILKDELREKDKNLRLSEQENDSLLFRNKQLVSRVDVLVNELHDIESKKSSKSKKVDALSSLPDVDVLTEELSRQIAENRDLRLKASESHETHKSAEKQLRDKIKDLEAPVNGALTAVTTGPYLKENRILKQQLNEHNAILSNERMSYECLTRDILKIESMIASLLLQIEECLFTEDKSAIRLSPTHGRCSDRCKAMLVASEQGVRQAARTHRNFYSMDDKSTNGHPINLEDKLGSLQKERDNYKLEVELQTLKVNKLIQSNTSLEKLVSTSITANAGPHERSEAGASTTTTDDDDSVAAIAVAESVPPPPAVVQHRKHSLQEAGDIIEDHMKQDVDVSKREKHIRDYYSTKIVELVGQLQSVDSKAVYFHAECKVLQKKLRLQDRTSLRLRSDLVNCNMALDKSKAEVDSTVDGYASQLSIMTEHITALNLTVSNQSEEIDELKYRLTVNI